jgi:hypothetical protein
MQVFSRDVICGFSQTRVIFSPLRRGDLPTNVEQVVLDIMDGVYREPPQGPFVGFGVVVQDRAVPVVSA